MGKLKAFIPIALALVIAFSGSIFLYKWLKVKTSPEGLVKVEAEAVDVAVAAVNLPWGTKLKPEMIKTVRFLKESLPEGFISKPTSLEGRVIITQLKQNEAITESKLAPEDVKVGGVSAILKPGKRAIAVKGDKVIGLSGFIQPGNLVDVLVTMQHPKTKNEVTKVVLEKIPVLATGTEMQRNGKGEPAPVDVYTLEVTSEEGEKLALAAARGRLQFALRNVTDVETVLTKGATIAETLSSLRHQDRKPKPVVGKGKSKAKTRLVRERTFTVEQIKGDRVNQRKFNL